MRRSKFVMLGCGMAAALLCSISSAGAAATGSARGTIVLERGHLPMPLDRAVTISATDFEGNPVGHIRYRADGLALHYEISGLPIGTTLLVELTLAPASFPDAAAVGPNSAIPILARSDRSSPIYAFALSAAAPVKAPLDFRVAVTRDPSPQTVSFVSRP